MSFSLECSVRSLDILSSVLLNFPLASGLSSCFVLGTPAKPSPQGSGGYSALRLLDGLLWFCFREGP